MAKEIMYLWECRKWGIGPKISKDINKLKDFLIKAHQCSGEIVYFVRKDETIDVRIRTDGDSLRRYRTLGYINPVEELS